MKEEPSADEGIWENAAWSRFSEPLNNFALYGWEDLGVLLRLKSGRGLGSLGLLILSCQDHLKMRGRGARVQLDLEQEYRGEGETILDASDSISRLETAGHVHSCLMYLWGIPQHRVLWELKIQSDVWN